MISTPDLVRRIPVSGLPLHAASLGSIGLCIGLWIRAKTVSQEERGNAERRALAPEGKELNGPADVLQVAQPEDDRIALGQVHRRRVGRRSSHEDFVGNCFGGHPGCHVDRSSEPVIATVHGRSGVDADANPKGPAAGADLIDDALSQAESA